MYLIKSKMELVVGSVIRFKGKQIQVVSSYYSAASDNYIMGVKIV